MLLITHAITGAALSTIQKSIPAGFFIGLVSHYLLDMIPHYDHNVEAFKNQDKAGIRKTLALIALDGLASVIIPLLLFSPANWPQFFILFSAIIGSILPDFLQGLALVFKNNRFIQAHQRFQEWIHTKIRINHIPHIAIPAQVAFNLAFIWFGYYFA
jgi:hypothetical protein